MISDASARNPPRIYALVCRCGLTFRVRASPLKDCQHFEESVAHALMAPSIVRLGAAPRLRPMAMPARHPAATFSKLGMGHRDNNRALPGW